VNQEQRVWIRVDAKEAEDENDDEDEGSDINQILAVTLIRPLLKPILVPSHNKEENGGNLNTRILSQIRNSQPSGASHNGRSTEAGGIPPLGAPVARWNWFR
jgi:hypothetical protein